MRRPTALAAASLALAACAASSSIADDPFGTVPQDLRITFSSDPTPGGAPSFGDANVGLDEETGELRLSVGVIDNAPRGLESWILLAVADPEGPAGEGTWELVTAPPVAPPEGGTWQRAAAPGTALVAIDPQNGTAPTDFATSGTVTLHVGYCDGSFYGSADVVPRELRARLFGLLTVDEALRTGCAE